jgi:hypothetical protein
LLSELKCLGQSLALMMLLAHLLQYIVSHIIHLTYDGRGSLNPLAFSVFPHLEHFPTTVPAMIAVNIIDFAKYTLEL